MNRRLLFFLPLFAIMPGLLCAQEAKLVNCRTLESAGNFVASNEVVVDDLVCQKLKPGAAEASAKTPPAPPKPLPGTVVSDTEPESVVDAAKASTKRVAAAVEANAEKAAASKQAAASTSVAETEAQPVTQPEALNPVPEAETSDPQPMSVAEAARANAKRMADADAVPEKPTPVAKIPFGANTAAKPQPAKTRNTKLTEPSIAPANAPAESSLMKATPAAPAAPLSAPKKPAPVEVKQVSGDSAPPAVDSTPTPSTDIVIMSAPSREASPAVPLPATKGPTAVPAKQVSADSAPPAVDSTPTPSTDIVIMSAPSSEAATPAVPLPAAKGPTAVPAKQVSGDSAPPAVEPTPTPSTDIVIMSAPSREAASPAVPLPEPKGPAPATAKQVSADSPPPAIESTSGTAGIEKVSGFYDANAPKNSSNHAAVTLGVVGAPPAGAVVSPADESPANPPANSSNAATEAAPAPEETAPAPTPADSQSAWPGNAEPNMERERVVETGAFALPKEVPDPNQPAHSKQITPSAEDGFQEGQRASCRKNITIGGLKDAKLVLGVPKWAADWIAKNQKRMLDACFSDTPMPDARNYLIVFYTSAPPPNATLSPSALPAQGTSPAGGVAAGVGTFTTSYGSTWHYFYDRNVGITVNSSIEEDQPQSQPDKLTYATAYTEEGVPVAQHWQGAPKKQIKLDPNDPNVRKESKKERRAREEMEQVSDALLSQMVEEIEKL